MAHGNSLHINGLTSRTDDHIRTVMNFNTKSTRYCY